MLPAATTILLKRKAHGSPSCDGARRPFTALAYSPTRGGQTLGGNATIRHYPSISFPATLSLDRVGDMANVTVPCLRFGECDPRCPRKKCADVDWDGYHNGTDSLAKLFPGRVAVRLGGFHQQEDLLPLRNASRCAAFCNGTRSTGLNLHGDCYFRGVWWDQGMAALRKQASEFFDKYRAAGGALDEITQDSEQGLTTFNLFDWFGDPANATVHECLAERWDTLAADPRWPPLLAQLRARGFQADPSAGPEYLSAAMRFSADQASIYVRNRAVFNQLMAERGAAYWNKALFEPARRAFPHVRYSDWGDASSPYYYRVPALCMPTGNGDVVCPPPGATGWPPLNVSAPGAAIVGNEMTGNYYDSFGNQPSWAAPGTNATLARFWGVKSYPKTPFNGFRWNVFRGRGVLYGIADVENVPNLTFKPWFQPPPPPGVWPINGLPPQQVVRYAKYQTEQLVHLSLAGMGGILLFNPVGPGFGTSYKNNEHIQSVYELLDRLVGCAARAPVADTSGLRFEDSFMLTGASFFSRCAALRFLTPIGRRDGRRHPPAAEGLALHTAPAFVGRWHVAGSAGGQREVGRADWAGGAKEGRERHAGRVRPGVPARADCRECERGPRPLRCLRGAGGGGRWLRGAREGRVRRRRAADVASAANCQDQQ